MKGITITVKLKKKLILLFNIYFRIFWLLSFFCAMSFAVYFIVNIYEKYDNSPVIISYNPKVVPLLSIPFPAVTICNLNQALKSEAEKILTNG